MRAVEPEDQDNETENEGSDDTERKANAVRLDVAGFPNTEAGRRGKRVCFANTGDQLVFSYAPWDDTLQMLSRLPAALSKCTPVTQALTALSCAAREHKDVKQAVQGMRAAALTDDQTALAPKYSTRQHCAFEYWTDLTAHLREDGAIQTALRQSTNPFADTKFKTERKLSCPSCEKRPWTVSKTQRRQIEELLGKPAPSRDSTQHSLQMSVAQLKGKSLNRAVNDSIDPETLAEYKCSCGQAGVHSFLVYKSSPALLVVPIARLNVRTNRKDNSAVDLPAASRLDQLRADYELIAAALHAGSLSSGHYRALVSRLNSDGVREWFLCNDDEVERADLAETLKSREFQTQVVLALYQRKGGGDRWPKKRKSDSDDDSDTDDEEMETEEHEMDAD